MRRILILEDHEQEQQQIAELIGSLEQQTELVACRSTNEAYAQALEKNIDLFIVDVILDPKRQEDTSGLRFVENIRGVTRYEFTPVIILTCLEDLRSYSYENLHCYAFIEKPFRVEHLKQSIEACLRSPRLKEEERTLYYRKDGAILAIRRSEITHVISMLHKLYIYTEKDDCIVIPYLTIKQFLEDVQSRDFIQCSRSCVVNRSYVTALDLPRKLIHIKGGTQHADIGGRYAAAVKEAFGGMNDT